MTLTVQYQNKKKKEDLSFVNRETYFKIWGFMRCDLHLEKTELLVYMIIFSYYYYSGEYFSGSREYLSEWCGSGRTAVDEALKSLESKGYIISEVECKGGIPKTYYTVNPESLPRCAMFRIEHQAFECTKKINTRKAT